MTKVKNNEGYTFTLEGTQLTVVDRFQITIGQANLEEKASLFKERFEELSKQEGRCTFGIQLVKQEGRKVVVMGPYGLQGGGRKQWGKFIFGVGEVAIGIPLVLSGNFLGVGLTGAGISQVCSSFTAKEKDISFRSIAGETAKDVVVGTVMGGTALLGNSVFQTAALEGTKRVAAQLAVGAFSSSTGHLSGAATEAYIKDDSRVFLKELEPTRLATHAAMGAATQYISSGTKAITNDLVKQGLGYADDVAAVALNGAVSGAAAGAVTKGFTNIIKMIKDDAMLICYTTPPADDAILPDRLYIYIRKDRICFRARNQENKIIKLKLRDDEFQNTEALNRIKAVLLADKGMITPEEVSLLFEVTARHGFPRLTITTGIDVAAREGLIAGLAFAASDIARDKLQNQKKPVPALGEKKEVREISRRIVSIDGREIDPNSEEAKELKKLQLPSEVTDIVRGKRVFSRRIVSIDGREIDPASAEAEAKEIRKLQQQPPASPELPPQPAAKPQDSSIYQTAKGYFDIAVDFASFDSKKLWELAGEAIADGQNALGNQKGVHKHDTKLVNETEKALFKKYNIPTGVATDMLVTSTEGRHRDGDLHKAVYKLLVDHQRERNQNNIIHYRGVMDQVVANNPPPLPPPPTPRAITDTKSFVAESAAYAKSVGFPKNYFVRAHYMAEHMTGSSTDGNYQSLYSYLVTNYDHLWDDRYNSQDARLADLINRVIQGQTNPPAAQSASNNNSSLLGKINQATDKPIVLGVSFQLTGQGVSFGSFGNPRLSNNLQQTIAATRALDNVPIFHFAPPQTDSDHKINYVDGIVGAVQEGARSLDNVPNLQGVASHFVNNLNWGGAVYETLERLDNPEYKDRPFTNNLICSVAATGVHVANGAAGAGLGLAATGNPVGAVAGAVVGTMAGAHRADMAEQTCHQILDNIPT